jgi:transposase-like protein
MNTTTALYRGYRFPAEIISYCVRLHFRIVNLTLVVEKFLLQVGGIYHLQSVSSAGVGCEAPGKPRIYRSVGAP